MVCFRIKIILILATVGRIKCDVIKSKNSFEDDCKSVENSAENSVDIMENILKYYSVLYGLVAYAKAKELSPKCFSEMKQLHRGINRKEIWAIKALDGSGNLEPGFTIAQNHWFGSRITCKSANNPLQLTISDRYERKIKQNLTTEKAPFLLDYRIIYAKHKSAWQINVMFQGDNILHLGLCIPKSCNNNELYNLTQKYLSHQHLPTKELFETKTEVILVKDLRLSSTFWMKPSVIMAGIITIITFALVFYANINKKEVISMENNNVEIQPQKISLNLLDCFNAEKNFYLLYNTSINEQIPVICGIKVIACFFILLFHMQWYTFATIQNRNEFFHYAENPIFIWLSNSHFMVDAFFTISGFLLAYNFIKNKSRIHEVRNNNFYQNLKLYGKLLLHRHLRLTPLYLVMNITGELATSIVVQISPFWFYERNDITCSKYWWRNLLYIQNWFHVDDLCLTWTWSMACDMQYYMLFTILLFIYSKNHTAGKWVFLMISAAFFITHLAVTLINKYVPSYDVLFLTGTHIYIAPYSRIAPYIVGVFAGWLMAEKQQIQLKRSTMNILWILSFLTIILCFYSNVKRDFSYIVHSIILVLHRWLFGVAIAWFIIANVLGYKSIIIDGLSSGFFVHLNKLTYAIYYINPIIIILSFGLSNESYHLNPATGSVLAMGITLMSYIAALYYTIMFEIPYYRISRKLLKMNSQTKKR